MPQVKSHPSFRFIRQEAVQSLNIQVEEFEHVKTGAKHYHLNADSEENVFLVALRTVPEDSRGVAHILEHTALCGSKRYPVRDPFFMMTRRSLNTFMNAFTSSDWTAYPFASLNRKDFNNLLDVYLDAVFFSRLDPLDFAQEGHRLEFEEHNNPDSPLTYKGVVYNEMKGAMSSVPSQLWQTLTKYLFPTSTYHYNSGGEPEHIPDLSYEQLKEFYQTHYHPSNAIFMTYGDIAAAEHQEKFENQALKEFTRLDHTISVADEKRYFAPVRVQESYACNEQDLDKKTHVVLAWLLGKSTNLNDSLKAQLLSSVLLDNSASPLMHSLETSSLGSSPSPLCGLDDSQKELNFICGLQGCDTQSSDEVEKLILATLQKVAEDGVAQEDIESALHQLELGQREIGGDSYPYGLQLIMTSLTAATHRGDPVKLLNLDAALDELRKEIKDPDFIKQLAKELLINNPHRVRLSFSPNEHIASLKEAEEKQRLANIKAALKAEQKQQIIEQAQALKQRQDAQDDESILPKVTLADVPKQEAQIHPDIFNTKAGKLSAYKTGTNGLCYQQIIFNFPKTAAAQLQLLPIYNYCISELGVGDKDYMAVQRWQARVSGGFGAFSSIRGEADNVENINAYYVFSGKSLNRNQQQLCELMEQTIQHVRFDEISRIKELVSQMRAQREQSITGHGHGLAMAAACAGICTTAALSHRLTGLEGIQHIKALSDSLADGAALDTLGAQLASLHRHLTSGNRQFMLVAEDEQMAAHVENFKQFDSLKEPETAAGFGLDIPVQKVNQAWLTTSQVNFCAKAFPTVPMSHADAAPLVVLGNFLRNGFLHKAVREQGGAYGGGAAQDSNSAAFKFYSYRDPRLKETLLDFDQAVEWLLNTEHSRDKVEEAILGTVSSLDRSESPAGKAKRLFHSELHGRTEARRQLFREGVLGCTAEDLKRVATTYLQPDKANTAVISDFANKDAMIDLGFEVKSL
ncbi:MAG: insulinase family protein [Cellvibrionaceae bacterium]|nr:insulinase family protein [Cellvibrionaceae bacterium]